MGTEVINATVTCLSNGTWTLDSDALHCRPLAKCALPTADTKLVVPPSCVNEEGQACEFACVDDHEVAEGETYITCTLSGEWSSPLPRCIPAVKRPSVHTDGTTGMHLALDGRHDLLFTADNRAEPVGVLAVADRMTAVDREGGALDSLESSIADDVGALSTEQSAALSSLVLATETSTVAFQAAAAGTRDTLSRGIETMNSALDEEHTELSSALSGVDARLTTGEDTLASVSTAEVAAAASLAAVDATLSSDLASEIATTAAARKTTNEKLDVVTDNVFLLAESHGDLSDSHSALTSSVVALLEDEITVMRTRALAAESVLSNGVGSVSSGVSGETTRATKTESALSGRLDQLTASVTTERNRATTRENSIDSRVTGVSNTVNSVSSRASAVSKSAYTVSIQTRSVSSAVNSVSGQDASVKSKIDTTTSRLSGLCTAVGGKRLLSKVGENADEPCFLFSSPLSLTCHTRTVVSSFFELLYRCHVPNTTDASSLS